VSALQERVWSQRPSRALGICCGIPVLATLGALGFLAGLSMTSWMLVVLGAVAAVVGGWRAFRTGASSGRRFLRLSAGQYPQRVAETTSEKPILPKEH